MTGENIQTSQVSCRTGSLKIEFPLYIYIKQYVYVKHVAPVYKNTVAVNPHKSK